jgi:hypothetical protein
MGPHYEVCVAKAGWTGEMEPHTDRTLLDHPRFILKRNDNSATRCIPSIVAFAKSTKPVTFLLTPEIFSVRGFWTPANRP